MGQEGKRNYQKELESILSQLPEEDPPRLLLHGCCAPCSSYVLEYLSAYFRITLFFYNPNIAPYEEYEKRREEAQRLVRSMQLKNPVEFLETGWENQRYQQMAAGLEELPEGGARCLACYRLRLEKTAQLAAQMGFPYFATTLTISPLKDPVKINRLGEEAAQRWGLGYLPSDFKKKNGFRRSVELSKQYDLYRQNYCGCIYSRLEAERREKDRTQAGNL